MMDWSQVVQEYGPIVWKTVSRLLNNEADAADCFQNTFVSALKLSRAETVHNWAGLLKRLATARALDRLRQRRRESSRCIGMPEGFHPTEKAPGPSRVAESIELTEHLRNVLADLDARQAEVFCLACLEDFDYRHIAEQLGLTVGHVGVLLNRAKSSLRERLRAHAPPSPKSL
ncbi:MAG: RNA polymerase sigma factor [Thermoguttaceae bacterium]